MLLYVGCAIVSRISVFMLTRRTWEKDETRLPPRTTTAIEPRTRSKGGVLS